MATETNPVKTSGKKLIWTMLIAAPIFMGIGALAVIWYWNANKDSIIREKLENAIQERTNGIYAINYDSSEISESKGNLSLYNLHLKYDSVKFEQSQRAGVAPPVLFSIMIPEISVQGVNSSRALSKNEIVGKKLVIREPIIDMYYTYQGNNATRNLPTEQDYKEILSGLDLVEVDTVEVRSAAIRTFNRPTGKMIAEGKNINITLINLKIDSAAFFDKTRMMFARDVDIRIGDVNWISSDKLYNFKIGNIALSTESNILSMSRFTVKPTLGENEFVQAKKYQDDRFDFTTGAVLVTGIDIKGLGQEKLIGQAMTVQSPNLLIYRDLARPREPQTRIGSHSHQSLFNLPFLFSINNVILKNGYVEYKERNNITRASGRVRFHSVNGMISNLTNRKEHTGKQLVVELTSRFLNQTDFNTKWRFFPGHPEGRFTVSGNVGAINGTSLNVLTEPMGPSHIREGMIQGLDFDLTGDKAAMSGTVRFLYSDLKIDLLERDKPGEEMDKKFLSSLLANLMIKKANPRPGEAARAANISVQRDASQSMISLCWASIFKGIQESMGLKN